MSLNPKWNPKKSKQLPQNQLKSLQFKANPNDFKKPHHFIPERWEKKSEEDQHIVFGIGEQRCPSINFTPFYYKSYLYELLNKFKYTELTGSYESKELPHLVNK